MKKRAQKPEAQPNRDLLTTAEAAALVRRSAATVIRWILHEGLAAVRIKGRYLIDRKALLQMMEQAGGFRPTTPGQVVLPMSPADLAAARRHGLI